MLRDIGFLYTVSILIELAVGSSPLGLYGVYPHPYWLIILGMAAAHGTVVGMLTAVIGLTIQSLGLMADGMSAPLAFTTLLSDPLPLLCFFGGAFLVGEIHDAHASTFRRVETKLQTASRTAARLGYERDVLLEANARLKERIEELPVHVASAFDSTTQLEREGVEDPFALVLRLVRKHCGATKSSVIDVATDGTLTVAKHDGWTHEDLKMRAPKLSESRVLAQALKRERPLKAFEVHGVLGATDPLFVAPLRTREGRIGALLCVDEVPTQQLSPESASVFFGIAEWAETSLDANQTRHPSSATDAHPPLVIASQDEFGERLHVETHRAERYGTSLAVVAIHADGWRHGSAGAQTALDRELRHLLASDFHGKTLYRFGHPGCYVIVLTEGDEALRSVNRTWTEKSDARLECSVRATRLEPTTPDAYAMLDELDREFRLRSTMNLDPACPVSIPHHGRVGDLDGLLRRIPMETSVASTTGDPCQLVLIESRHVASEDTQSETLPALAASLRPSDGVFMLESNTLVLLLPATDANGTDTAVARCIEFLTDAMVDARPGDFHVKRHTLGTTGTHADHHLKLLGILS